MISIPWRGAAASSGSMSACVAGTFTLLFTALASLHLQPVRFQPETVQQPAALAHRFPSCFQTLWQGVDERNTI
jgi:hypothetical protein